MSAEHGADIYAASKETGMDENEIIDFSSNINPLGVPEEVMGAIVNSLKHINRYPDINSRELIKSISGYECVPESNIYVSNGAAEAIFRIAALLKPRKGLVTAPAFGEYEQALKSAGAHVSYFNLYETNNFKITKEIIRKIDKETDVVFICNPNNPTGQITEKNLIEEILTACKKSGTIVVVDECFMDFVEDKNNYSSVKLLESYDNLIIVKAFTKIFAIPGIRLGYCMSLNEHIIKNLKNSGPPWNVSTVAQAAGIAAVNEDAYVNKSVIYVKNQRHYLVNEMNKLGIRTYDSFANYVFFSLEGIDLKKAMLKKGILIRSCSNYVNLHDNYYRIAVKTERENRFFMKVLREILEEI